MPKLPDMQLFWFISHLLPLYNLNSLHEEFSDMNENDDRLTKGKIITKQGIWLFVSICKKNFLTHNSQGFFFFFIHNSYRLFLYVREKFEISRESSNILITHSAIPAMKKS